MAVRLSQPAWERYSAEASAQGKGLSTYLRERLEQQDEMLAEIAALRRLMEERRDGEGVSKAAPADGAPANPGTFIEVLLLLRTLVGHQKAVLVQKEVERRGFQTWS